MNNSEIDARLRNEIIDAYGAYAEGIDSKNWSLVRSCFADEVYIDYGEISAADGGPEEPRPIEKWMAHLQGVINGFDHTHHTLSNFRFNRDGERIACRAYLTAHHVIFSGPEPGTAGVDDVVTIVGEYTNSYERADQGWKIHRSRLQVYWSSGNPNLFPLAMQRAANMSSESNT
ncbi:MAG: nuclear transport factor 2 family protein [Pseudomonadales bacterium]